MGAVSATPTVDAPLVSWGLETVGRLLNARRISKRLADRLATALLRAQDAGDGARVAWIADRFDQGYRLYDLAEHAEGLVVDGVDVGRALAVTRLLDALEIPTPLTTTTRGI